MKIVLLSLVALIVQANAETLITAYKQALKHDPTYAQIIAQNNSIMAQHDIDLANLLPTVKLNGSTDHDFVGSTAHTNAINVSLDQTLFNDNEWLTIKADKTNNMAAQLKIAASLQDLMSRVAKAYLNVAQDEAVVLLDQKQIALNQKLAHQSKFLFNGGQKTETDVATSLANLNQAQATLITDQLTLNTDKAQLASLTGVYPKQVNRLKKHVPLIKPKPLNEALWLNNTSKHNLTVRADLTSAKSSFIDMKAAHAKYYPTVSTSLSYGYTRTTGDGTDVSGTGPSVNLTATVPLYQGGSVAASTEQAYDNYQSAFDQAQIDKEKFINQCRQSFIGIVKGAAEINTNLNLVKAEQKNYQTNLIAYKGGIRNASDVVMALNALYAAQIDYLKATYRFTDNIIQLKQAAGTLNIHDIEKLNTWLNS